MITQVERDKLIDLRDKGASYPQLATVASQWNGAPVSPDVVRGWVRRKKGKATPSKKRPREDENSRVLVISDMHHPFAHPDTIAFLAAVKEKYKPTRVICTGDEVDHHAMSFHDSDPDLHSAGDELKKAIKALKPLYQLFPVMDVLDSNHGSMAYRKGKHHGIARKYLRDYRDVLDAPDGWEWHNDMLITLPNGNKVFFHHGLSANILKVVQLRGVCVVQGHYHTSYGIQYASNPEALLWGMQVGCSIDKQSLAFAYDNVNLGRPVIGHGIIIDGFPKLLPMVLNKAGKWTGYVP